MMQVTTLVLVSGTVTSGTCSICAKSMSRRSLLAKLLLSSAGRTTGQRWGYAQSAGWPTASPAGCVAKSTAGAACTACSIPASSAHSRQTAHRSHKGQPRPSPPLRRHPAEQQGASFAAGSSAGVRRRRRRQQQLANESGGTAC